MLERSFVVAASTLPLEPWPLDPEQVVDGVPKVAWAVLHEDARVQHGVWEHTPGVTRDVEADEMFVVVSGSATIEVEGGPTLEVGPGDVGLLRAGDRTVWTVHKTLRKVFQITRR